MVNIFAAISTNNTKSLHKALTDHENFVIKNGRRSPPIHAAIDFGLANIVYWLAVNQPFLFIKNRAI